MYHYEWVKSVLDDLAQIYTAASVPERERMAAAVEAFNRRIATDPLSVGESRTRGHRVASIALLTV